MQMSKEEIIMRYEQAKSKNMQIKILAQLNDCPPRVIRKILTEAGVIKNKNLKQTEKEAPKPTKYRNEAEYTIPGSVMEACFKRLDVLEIKIKSLTDEYSEIVDFIRGGASID